jgi:cytochrome P450
MQWLSPNVGRIAASYVEQLDPWHIDWVQDFAFPFPVTVISELLGVPAADRDQFKHWADTVIPLGSRDPFHGRCAGIETSARPAVRAKMWVGQSRPGKIFGSGSVSTEAVS